MGDKRKQKFWSIDATVPFYENRIFLWALGVPAGLALLALFGLWWGPDSPFKREWLFSAEGYKIALELYAFPLYVLTFSGIFGVMVARFHRSKQYKLSLDKADESLAKAQKNIELASIKSDFDIREKHEESFLKYLSGIKGVGDFVFDFDVTVTLVARPSVYPLYFPKNASVMIERSPDRSHVLLHQEKLASFLEHQISLYSSDKLKAQYVVPALQAHIESWLAVSITYFPEQTLAANLNRAIKKTNHAVDKNREARFKFSKVREIVILLRMVHQLLNSACSYRTENAGDASNEDTPFTAEKMPNLQKLIKMENDNNF